MDNKINENASKTIRVGGKEQINRNDCARLETILGYVFVPLFILVCFAIMLYNNGVYPFGKTTMSSYDMLAQVAPFIEHFYDVISGKSSLFYSYAIAGGADVFGTLAYCCVSPFTLIFLLFGDGNIYYGTSIVLPLKIACVGISALIYLKKRFKSIPTLLWIALALSYAFSGYLYVSNTYINWVDLMIYLPFVALGFKRIVDSGKKTTFIVALSLMIYTCFSISCFSLLIVFPIMICYCLIVVQKENRVKVITDIVIALCLTVAVCLPILVPSLMAFLGSGRKTGLFDNLLKDIAADPLYYKTSYLLTDGLTLIITLIYLYKNGVKRPIDRFLMIALAFTLAPVLIDEVCNLLNFGSYMSYALRFGFLNGFFFLFVAGLYIDELFKGKEFCAKFDLCEQEPAKKRLQIILSAGIILLVICGAVGAYILDIYVKNGSYTESFSARFAHSLGGLEVTAVIFAIVAIIALYGILLMQNGKLSHKLVIPILLIAVCGQSAFYTDHLIRGNKYTPTRYDQIQVLTDYAKQLDGHGDSRVKMTGDYLTAVMPFTLETNAFTVFSSIIDSRNFVPTTFFNFGGNGSNTMKSYNGTVLGDSLLGYKYFIVSEDDVYKVSNRSFIKKIDLSELADENGYLPDYGEYSLYKNEYAFPSAFTIHSIPTAFENDRFGEFDALMYALNGDHGVYVSEMTEDKIIELNQDADGNEIADKTPIFRVKNMLNGAGNYYFAYDFEDYDEIYYNTGASYIEKSQKPLPDTGGIHLGYGSSGSYSVCLTRRDGTPLTKEYIMQHTKTFGVLNTDVKNASERAVAEQAKVQLSGGKIEVEIVAEKDRYLMLNYVALPGHTVTVNGREAVLEKNSLNLMVIKLNEGENFVEIKYNSPYVKMVILGALLGLFILAAYYILFIKLKLLTNFVKKTVCVLAYGLAGGITLFFFVMPICVFVVKGVGALIKLIF